ncbi:MAG: chromosome segregation protein SMC [Clostridiales bacterium GWD2_32_59]|nr:MAG: chromosome segregation protein SMC [Clostridiales bacterium GWD2_32_59]
MKLKRLEIKGFKSFADKLNLEFDDGITCIVGPNGSGKSNIADAIRWVLGEQSAKSLRGAKMDEIVFSGTQTRKPLGMAEVCMHIDNSQGKLNTEFNEVEIKRRVYRSGEAEYLINDSACRLKDIYDLFYDTGIGKEGYSIIGQGKIDEILNNKPAERRSFFEEATGISKYRIRLKDTEKKLDEEKQNLTRVNDIVSELTNQIEPLCEQSEKAEKYLIIKEKLEEDELNIYIYDYKKAKEQVDNIEGKEDALKKENVGASDKLLQVKSDKTKLYEEHNKVKEEMENKKRELSHLELEVERKDGETKIIEEKINNAQSGIKELNERKNSLLDALKLKQELLSKVSAEYKIILSNIEKKEQLLLLKQEHYEMLDTATKDKENDLENIKTDIADKINKSYDLKTEKEKLIFVVDSLKEKLASLISEIANTDKTALGIDNEIIVNKKQLDLYLLQKKNVGDKISELTNKQTEYAKEIINLQNKERESSKDLSNIRSKHNVYVDMKNHHEGYGKSIKTILELKKNNEIKWKGICGVLGELINVNEGYEIAVDVALGARVQNIVVDEEKTAKEVIDFLKQNKHGRATFLPISSVKSNERKSLAKNILLEAGVLGVLSDFVTCEDIYSSIVDSMLGKTIVIDNIENAIIFAKKYKYAYKVVTLEGEVFNAGGSVTGGSISSNTANLFTRSREIEVLKVNIEKLEVDINRQHEDIKKVTESKQLEERELIIKNKELQNLEYELVKIKNNYEMIERAKSDSLEKNSRSTLEKASIKKQLIEIEEEIKYKEMKVKEVEENIEESKQKIETHRSSLDAEKLSKFNITEEITTIKVELSGIMQKNTTGKEEQSRLEQEVSGIADEVKELETKIEGHNVLIDKNVEAKKLLIQKIQIEKDIIIGLSKKTEVDGKTFIDFENKMKVADEEIIELSTKINATQDKIYKLENSNVEYKIKMENIEEQLFEKYKLTYDEAKAHENDKFSYNKAKESIREYKSQIERLGNVNLDAIEQYKTIKERYDFLVYQRDDIQKAEKKLEEIIRELLQAMQKQFEYEFKEIDKNFDEIFKEMFGGGRAHLKLVNEENTLESGIEIVVEPPGKHLQNIMLLSGGEKALTAISLLFAILKLRPSPFCVLDEIEAALDDANVTRYANYIKNYSKNTQFLVITHRKGTMEISDYLYGVTMQEKGISKVISVKLEEVEG